MSIRRYDYIIVGCGFYGATLAERLNKAGKSVKIIERRGHIGGNSYSYRDALTGIEVHRYGTHIFHTDDTAVWKYVNSFDAFTGYRHRVLTTHKKKVYALPIGLDTINAFYGKEFDLREAEEFLAKKCPRIDAPKNFEEKAISIFGPDLYEAFIKGYTIKQWGVDPKELPASIGDRLFVKMAPGAAYFSDRYQGLPSDGYTALFERMLDGIPVELKTDFFEDREEWFGRCDTLVYTGPIDRYFGYTAGALQWRSVRFETVTVATSDYQGVSVMNFADLDVPYTRIHEPRHLYPERTVAKERSVIMREYPHIDADEPYYPVNSPKDAAMLAVYRNLAKSEKNVLFGGRLAEYRYYDMDDAIAAALETSHRLLSGRHCEAAEQPKQSRMVQ